MEEWQVEDRKPVPDPSCYPKVIMAAGVTELIFAKERICAGEELYNYHYQPDTMSAWDR